MPSTCVNEILVDDAIAPSTDDKQGDDATLKVLTIVSDRLYFAVKPDWLAEIARQRFGRFVGDMESVWCHVPERYNPQLNQEAFRRIAYGGQSLLPGMLEIDSRVSACVTRTMWQHGGFDTDKLNFSQLMLAAWLWYERGFGFGTNSRTTFDVITLLTRAFPTFAANQGGGLPFQQDAEIAKQAAEQALHAYREPIEVFEWLVPNFAALDWEEIAYLRSHELYAQFRHWFSDAAKVRDAGEFRDRVTESLWRLAHEVTPHGGSVILKSLVGLTSLGLATTLSDFVEAAKLQNGFAPHFWVAEARNLAERKSAIRE